MNINDNYYKKISYKKNTYEDLKMYLKMYHRYKSVIFISTKSCPISAMTSIVNAITFADCKFKHFCVSNGFDREELNKIDSYISKTSCDIIVGLGGGKCCDVCKYFAKKADCMFLFSPTMPSSLAYFSSYCVNPVDSSSNFYYQQPEKLYISETLIRSLNKEQFNRCLINFVSYFSVVNDLAIAGSVECEEKIDRISRLYQRMTEELCGTDNEENNLVLMDLFIDLGFELSGLDLNNFTLINFYSIAKKFNLDERCVPILPICADMYSQICYKISGQNEEENIDVYKILQNKNLFKKLKISEKNSKNLHFLQKNCENKLISYKFSSRKAEIVKTFKNVKTLISKTIKTHQMAENFCDSINLDVFFEAFNLLLMFNPSNSYISKLQLAGRLNFA